MGWEELVREDWPICRFEAEGTAGMGVQGTVDESGLMWWGQAVMRGEAGDGPRRSSKAKEAAVGQSGGVWA